MTNNWQHPETDTYTGLGIPPPIKTIFIPEPGCVLVEGDWKQAELFVLAYLSRDKNMTEALTTPGRDLHDTTTNKSFGIKVFDAAKQPVSEDDLVALARRVSDKEFKKHLKTLSWVDQRGNVMNRSAYKNSIRVSGKNVGFGVPYGRGAEAIAIQVKAETGSPRPIVDIQVEIQRTIDTWKSELYPDAWAYMVQCNQSVKEPGWLANPWERVRKFPFTTDKKLLASMGREAQNWPELLGWVSIKRG